MTLWKNRTPAELAWVADMTTLKCHGCGYDNLHQGDVTIYERKEDAPFTTVIAQDGENVNVTKFPSGDTWNPSSRRYGLTIKFECEHCEGGTLAIYQHKGNTFVEWVS